MDPGSPVHSRRERITVEMRVEEDWGRSGYRQVIKTANFVFLRNHEFSKY